MEPGLLAWARGKQPLWGSACGLVCKRRCALQQSIPVPPPPPHPPSPPHPPLLLLIPLQFYFVFSLASMYIAMLMTGWGSLGGVAMVGGGGARDRDVCVCGCGRGKRGECGRRQQHAQRMQFCTLSLSLPAALHKTPAACLRRCCLSAALQYLLNVGWTSVWVKIASQWVTVALYCWTLVAPLLFPDRDFA